MGDGNGQQPPQFAQVPFDHSPTPQQVFLQAHEGMVRMLIVMPGCSVEMVMDRKGALGLADEIREKAGGLTVVDNVSPLTVDQILNPRGDRP